MLVSVRILDCAGIRICVVRAVLRSGRHAVLHEIKNMAVLFLLQGDVLYCLASLQFLKQQMGVRE